MAEQTVSRRVWLAGVASGVVTGVAGCSGGGDGGPAQSPASSSGTQTDSGTDTDAGPGGLGDVATAGTAWPTRLATPERNPVLSGTSGPAAPLTVAWRASGAAGARPSVWDGVVYADFGESLRALDLVSGDPLWRVPLPGDAVRTPRVGDDTLYTLDSGLTVFSRADGTERWQDSRLTGGSLVVRDGTVYGATDDATFAFEPGGTEAWRDDRRGTGESATALDHLAADEDRLYTVDDDGTVTAFALDDGTREWTQTVGTRAGGLEERSVLNVAGGAVYLTHVPADTAVLSAFDPATGSRRWQTPIASPSAGPAVTAEGVHAYIPGSETDAPVFATLDPATGEARRELSPVPFYGSQPVVADGRLYQHSQDGIVAVDIETGDIRWDRAEGPSEGSLVVTETAILYTSGRQLVCLQSA